MSDTTISLKNSTTSGSVPSNALVTGEVAINIQDKKAWVGLASGSAPVLFVDFNAAAVLSSGSITSGMIGNNAVNSGNIASGQVGLYHLASGTIFSLSSGIITSGFIGDNAVNSGNISSGQVSNYHLSSGAALGNLSSGSISSGTFILGDGVVTSGNIASGLLSNFTISSGSITSGLIGNNAVNSGNISSGAVGHFHIADNAVQSGNIASGQISHFHIANNAVQSGNIASGNVGLYKLDALTTTHTANSGLLVGQVLSYTGSGMIWKDNENEILIVRNNTGVSMPKGSVVYISGGLGNKPLVTLADATTDTTSSKTIGLLQDTIGDNQEGRCLVSGILEDVDTVAYSVGDRLYLSITAGQWTTTRYQAPVGHQVYLGTVVRSHINFGRIAVSIQNGFEVEELHDVRVMSGSYASGQVLQYTTQSGGYWQNVMYSVGSGYISNSAIQSGNIASGQVGQFHLSSGTAIANLASGSIKSGGWILGNGVIQSGNIASGLIPTSFTITSGSVTSGMIGNGAVVSGSIASGQVSYPNIAINSGFIVGQVLTMTASGSLYFTFCDGGLI
jgi:hypothetical protein